MTPLVPQESSSSLFLQTMEELLLKRQSSSKKNRLGKNNNKNTLTAGFNPALAKIMQSKPKNAATEKKTACSVGTHFKSSELIKKKPFYCEGSDHLDLSNTNVKNIAIYYLKNEIGTSNSLEALQFKNLYFSDSINATVQKISFENSMRNLFLLMNQPIEIENLPELSEGFSAEFPIIDFEMPFQTYQTPIKI